MGNSSYSPPAAQAHDRSPESEKSARFLAQLLAALGASTTSSDLAARAAIAAVEALGDWCAIWLGNQALCELRLSGVHHRQPDKVLAVQRLAEGWAQPGNRRMRDRIKELEKPVAMALTDDTRKAEFLGSPELARLAQDAGAAHVLLAPLAIDGQHFGLMAVGSGDPETAYAERELALAGEIAWQLSTAIEQLRRFEMAREASQQLALTSLRLQTVIDSVPQGLIVTDAPEGRVVYTNNSLVRILGRPVDLQTPVSHYPKLFGLARATGEPYQPEDIPWVRTARTGQAAEVEEVVIHRPDGSEAALLCSTSPILNGDGKAIGTVAILQDITDRREFERQKDEFLEMVSHELRTPLASLKGSAQLLRRRAQAKSRLSHVQEEVDMLEIIDRQVGRLNRLVSDLMEFATMQMGRLELHRTKVSLGALAKDLVAQMQVTAPDHDLLIEVRGETIVDADPDRIEQVLSNLISNAIKATGASKTGKARGRVEVAVRREGKTVVVSVRDYGMGIPQEAQPMVFDQLYRGRQHTHEGMGLGLYISKGIIDAHGGRIWLESEERKGTVIFFSLQAVGGERAVEKHQRANAGSGGDGT